MVFLIFRVDRFKKVDLDPTSVVCSPRPCRARTVRTQRMPPGRRRCGGGLSPSIIFFLAAGLSLRGDSLTITPEDDLTAVFRDAPWNAVISVGEGRYTGSCGAIISKSLSLRSLRGSAATVFDCGSRSRHLSIRGPNTNVTISGITFVNGSENDGTGGGCLLVDGGAELTVENCVFSECSSNAAGGAMLVDHSALKMNGALLTNTKAASSGGALAIHFSSSWVDNCTFSGSSAGSGGGAISLLQSSLNASAALLSKSTASTDGGAVHATQLSSAIFSASVFSDNTAGGRGGALHVEESSAEMSHISSCSFDRNVAGISGGAIYAAAAKMQITECQIRQGQAASDGGGVASEASIIWVDNSSISESHAGRHGGGLLIAADSTVVLSGTVVLEGNEARGRGGGVHVHSGSLEFDGGSLRVSGNQAGTAGGGISYLDRIVLKDGHSFVADNTAATGGGICGMGGRAELEIGIGHEVLVERCSAALDGGGVALVELARLVLDPSAVCRDCASQLGVQLHLRDNTAARNGGAIYKSSHDETLAVYNLCFIGNLPSALATSSSESAFRVTIAGNSAGVAGGAVYQHGPDLRPCAQLVSPSLVQARRLLTDAVLKVENNIAGAYGNEMASMPSQIQISAIHDGVIPGQSALHFDMSLADSLGQLVHGTVEHPLLHVISVLVCSVDTPECTPLTSLQSGALFQTHAQNPTSPLQDGELVLRCPVASPIVRVHVSIGGSHHNVSAAFDLQCAPCQSGQSRKEYAWNGLDVWSCESCPHDHYILDPNNSSHSCQECPAGARCNGTHLAGLLEGERWLADHARGIYLLAHCPPGSELVGIRNWNANIASEHDAQQCRPCVPGLEYVVDSDKFPCTRCPEGAYCADGTGLVGKVAGSVWEADQGLGVYKLVGCPPGHQLINSTDQSGVFVHDAQRCERCDCSQYVLDPATTKCQDCAIGGVCDSTRMLPRDPGSVWAQEEGRLRIVACDVGFVLVRDPSNPLLDQCFPCPHGSYSMQRAVYGPVGERYGPIATSVGDATGLCSACPVGARCVGGRVEAQAGYWVQRMGAERRDVEASEELKVFKCPPDACGEGGECKAGREGVVCGVCSSGWAMSSGRCLDCHGDPAVAIAIVAVLAVIVLGAFLYLVVVHPLRQFRNSPEAGNGKPPACFGRKETRTGPSSAILLAYFKIVAGFYQILATFLYTYDVSWGSAHDVIMQIASIFSLNVLDFPGFSCLAGGMSVEGRVVLFTVAPAILIMIPLAAGIVFVFSTDRNLKDDSERRSQFTADALLGPVLIILFLVYPTVTHSTFSQFNCRDFGGGHWLLRSDYSTECPSGSSFVFVWSLVMGIIYALGTIVLFCMVLFAHDAPSVARAKMLDENTYAMTQHYQRMHTRLELDAICKACGLKRNGINDIRDKGLSTRMTSSIFRLLSASKQGKVTGDYLADFLQDRGLFGLSRSTVKRITDSHAQKKGVLTEAAFHAVMMEMLRLSVEFPGPHSLGTLSDHEIGVLLKHGHAITGGDVDERTQLQTMSAERFQKWASKDSSPPDTDKSRLEHEWQLQELMLYLADIGVLNPGHACWDGALGDAERVFGGRLAFLVQPYKVECWWWDLFELLEKLLFATIMTFVAPNTPAQLGIGLLASVFFLAVAVRVRPFHDPRAEMLHVFASVALCLTLIYGLVKQLAFASSEDTHAAEAILHWVSLLSIALVLFLPLLIELGTSVWHSPMRYLRRYTGPSHLPCASAANRGVGSALPSRAASGDNSSGQSTSAGQSRDPEATVSSPKMGDRSRSPVALTISESPRGLIAAADASNGEGARVTGGIGWQTPDRGARGGGGEWHPAAESPPALKVEEGVGGFQSAREDHGGGGMNTARGNGDNGGRTGFKTARDPRQEEEASGYNDPDRVSDVASLEQDGPARFMSDITRSETASASSIWTRDETQSIESGWGLRPGSPRLRMPRRGDYGPKDRGGRDRDWEIREAGKPELEELDLPSEASDPELKERVESWVSQNNTPANLPQQRLGARYLDEFPSPRHDGHWRALRSPHGPAQASHDDPTPDRSANAGPRDWETDSVVVLKQAPLRSWEASPRLGAATPRSADPAQQRQPNQFTPRLGSPRLGLPSAAFDAAAGNKGVPMSSLVRGGSSMYGAATGTPRPSSSQDTVLQRRGDTSATPTKIVQPNLSGHRGSAAGLDVVLPRVQLAKTSLSRSPQSPAIAPVFSSMPPQAWVPEKRGVGVFMPEMRPEEPDSGRFMV